jgi:hypothetical protein
MLDLFLKRVAFKMGGLALFHLDVGLGELRAKHFKKYVISMQEPMRKTATAHLILRMTLPVICTYLVWG